MPVMTVLCDNTCYMLLIVITAVHACTHICKAWNKYLFRVFPMWYQTHFNRKSYLHAPFRCILYWNTVRYRNITQNTYDNMVMLSRFKSPCASRSHILQVVYTCTKLFNSSVLMCTSSQVQYNHCKLRCLQCYAVLLILCVILIL